LEQEALAGKVGGACELVIQFKSTHHAWDTERALRWQRFAAEQGVPDVAQDIASQYGLEAARDPARLWMQRAAAWKPIPGEPTVWGDMMEPVTSSELSEFLTNELPRMSSPEDVEHRRLRLARMELAKRRVTGTTSTRDTGGAVAKAVAGIHRGDGSGAWAAFVATLCADQPDDADWWLWVSAEYADPRGQFELGRCYALNPGDRNDEARKWLTAVRDNPHATDSMQIEATRLVKTLPQKPDTKRNRGPRPASWWPW
jgi:hypothetical protein